MRDLEATAERTSAIHPAGLDGRTVTPIAESHYPSEYRSNPNSTPPVPLEIGIPKSDNELLNPEAIRKLRSDNTQRNLMSNRWFEIAGYTRWLATMTFLGALAVIGQGIGAAATAAALPVTGLEMGAIVTAIGASVASGAFIACVVGGLVFAGISTVMSQHSRKMFVEKTFDVQDFQMQRQAALIGKSVERAVDDPAKPGQQPIWSRRSEKSEAHASHAARFVKAPEPTSWVDKTAVNQAKPAVPSL